MWEEEGGGVEVMSFAFLAWSPEKEKCLRILPTQACVLQLIPGSPSAREPALSVEIFIRVISGLLGPPGYLVMREIMLPFNTTSDLRKSH